MRLKPLVATLLIYLPAIALVHLRKETPTVRAALQDNPHGNLTLDCSVCHTPDRWTPVTSTPRFRHEQVARPLEGAHTRVLCRSCHQSLVFSQVGTACADCHKDPHRGELGFQCESCHTSRTWTNKQEMFQIHNRTRFPLIAVHASVPCEDCHRNQQPTEFRMTSTECGSCHMQDFKQATNPNHALAGFSMRCEDCHLIVASDWSRTTFSHPGSFVLDGAHTSVECNACHASTFKGTPRDCVGCHQTDFNAARNPNHVASGFPTTCNNCHTTSAWQGATFTDHSRTRFPLTGAHQRVDCTRCHVGGRFTGTATDCFSCHQADYNRTTNPNHAASRFSTRCETCHSTSAFRPASFDHSQTRFALTGAHQRVDCTRCHPGGRYTGTPSDCNSCHQADYSRTTNPNHAAAGFPTTCNQCHSTSAWRPATSIDHSKTRFPLTGAHQRVDCTQCHVGGRYTGTPTDCVSCHQADFNRTTNPNHAASGFPTTCTQCHSTSAWRPATFDHGRTRFPLTGAHQRVDCTRCHAGGRYTGTPTACNSCHQADYARTANPNHAAAGFPVQCEQCHSTAAWRPATFNHRFPLNGPHNVPCAQCHVNAGNFRAFECILCHAHDRARMDEKHRERAGYTYTSAACYRCHPTGRH